MVVNALEPSPRKPWTPLMSLPAAKKTEEEKQTHALEFIALYLDRIESHLDWLATSTVSSAHTNVALVSAVGQIVEKLKSGR